MDGTKKRRLESNVVENVDPVSVTQLRSSSSNQQGGLQNQGAKELVDVLGSPSCQPAQLLQDASAHGSRKSSDLEDLFRRVKAILLNRNIRIFDKFTPLCNEFKQFLSTQEEKAQVEIANVKHEALLAQAEIANVKNEAIFDSARLKYDSQLEITKWKCQCHSLQEAISVLKDNCDVPQKNVPAEGAESSGHEVERGFHDCLKQMTQSELYSQILFLKEIIWTQMARIQSQNEMSRALTTELQKKCHQYESCVKVKPAEATGQKPDSSHEHESGVMLKAQEEKGSRKGHQQFDEICGSYTDDSATPNVLDNFFNDTKDAVTRFQRRFFEALKLRQKSWHALERDIVFATKNHIGLYVKSIVNEIFFEGFENESFNTLSGVSRFLDPELRQKIFYQYHRNSANNASDIEDPQFGEFYDAKVSSLWNAFPLCNRKRTKICSFEELSDLELGLQLALSFKAAARSVWLLHKLAFSFEPPASIFRVERGADVDPTYMDTIVKLEDDDRFIAKVGFMVTPGLRLRKLVMRCEVYLSGATTISS